jgi:hypothetical protein
LVAFACDGHFDSTFRKRRAQPGTEKVKPATLPIGVCGVECEPNVTGPDNVTEMPVLVYKGTD